MKRTDALNYVSWLLDDALNCSRIGSPDLVDPDCWLLGWQGGFAPLFVAVRSYLPGVLLTQEEAEDIATDFLAEKRWFSDASEPNKPDFAIRGEQ